nr:DMT family transporter [Tritonibacter mobilis]
MRILAVFLITAMSALIHAVGQQAELGQIIFWRSAVALVPITIYAALRRGAQAGLRAQLSTRNPRGHILRSLFGAFAMLCSFASLIWLPVANAQALSYLAPVLTLPLAAHFLGERLSVPVILGAILGLLGAVAFLWDAHETPGQGALWGIGAGLAYALTMAVVRVHVKALTRNETPAAIAFYFALTCSVIGLATLPFGWLALTPSVWALLIGAGLLGGLAHIASTEAVARSPISALAVFDYTGLIWAMLFDLLLFSHVPTPLSWLGIIAIAAAALFGAWRPKPLAV